MTDLIKTSNVYLLFSENYPFIEAICTNKTSLDNYLKGKLKEYENAFYKEPIKAELNPVKTFLDYEYEITINVPKINYEILNYKIDSRHIEKLNSSSTTILIGVSVIDSLEVYFFDNEDQAIEWENSIDEDDFYYIDEIQILK